MRSGSMGGMSIPESTPVNPNPYAPAAVATAAPFDRWRWLLAGVIGILGGYLTISSFSGGLLNVISGIAQYDLELSAQIVLQGVFALAVTAFAYLVAPGPFPRRVIAVVLFVVVAVAIVALLAARYSGGLRLPGPAFNVVLNPYWLVLLTGGLGWLIAAAARPIAYLSLLLTFIVMPLGFVFAINSISSGISTIVQLVLSLAIAIVILLVSRPAASSYESSAPVATSVAPPVTTASDLAPNAFVAMEEGAEVGDAPRPPAP